MTYRTHTELDRESWDSTNSAEMCQRIQLSGLRLDDDDARLVRHLSDGYERCANVYDLYRLNMLCHQAIGWHKAKEGKV